MYRPQVIQWIHEPEKCVPVFFKAEDEQVMKILSRYHFEIAKSRKDYVSINRKKVDLIFQNFNKNIPKFSDLLDPEAVDADICFKNLWCSGICLLMMRMSPPCVFPVMNLF